MDLKFTEKIALVTGSTAGIGFAIAKSLAIRATDSETVAFSLSDLSARFLTARNCMSLILKMKTNAESGLRVDQKITPTY